MAELRLHPEALNLSLEDLPPALRQGNFSLPNGSVLLQQLDTIDNAACGWIQFMSKVGWTTPRGSAGGQAPAGAQGRLQQRPSPQVSVDIFKGFPDEESIVNYTLNQAYQDNVTVFASESPSLGWAAPTPAPPPTYLPAPAVSSTLPLLLQSQPLPIPLIPLVTPPTTAPPLVSP